MIAYSLKSNSENMPYDQAMAMFTRCAKSMHTHESVTTFDFYDGSLIQCQYWGDKHPSGLEYTVTIQDQRSMKNSDQNEKMSMNDLLSAYITATDDLSKSSNTYLNVISILVSDYVKRGEQDRLARLLSLTDKELDLAHTQRKVGDILAMNLKSDIKDIDLKSKFVLD